MKMLYSFYCDKQLSKLTIIPHRFSETLAKICYDTFFISKNKGKHCANSLITCVCIQDKWLRNLGVYAKIDADVKACFK